MIEIQYMECLVGVLLRQRIVKRRHWDKTFYNQLPLLLYNRVPDLPTDEFIVVVTLVDLIFYFHDVSFFYVLTNFARMLSAAYTHFVTSHIYEPQITNKKDTCIAEIKKFFIYSPPARRGIG